MTTKARRKKQTARKQHKLEELDNIIDIEDNDYSDLKQSVKIKPEFPYRFTPNQKKFVDLALSKNSKIIFVSGLAGTAKTILATYCGLKVLESGDGQSLTYIRTIVESSDRSLGFLPGDLSEKINPYMKPLEDKLFELLPPQQVKILQNDERIDAMPVNFLRGMDFRPTEEGKNVKVLILDEFQNATKEEILTTLTRVGEGCKVFICGDPMQADIKNSGFSKIFDIFDDEESRENGIFTFKFTEDDIVRSKLVKYIIKKVSEK